jgi:2-polyprenyl-3-methyl-5-hydroxy-6-metoxy-1,4-benzoquinol methylase
MRLFRTPHHRNVPELLDVPGEADERDLRHTLRDIRRANIFGLGTWVVRNHLERLVRDLPPEQPLSVLDLATGSGDIPEELCRWARARGRNVTFTATDISETILRVAQERITVAGFGGQVRFTVCDATKTPFADGQFDITLMSLALHHLDLRQAHAIIREMARVSRLGFIINDIYRSQGAWIMARILAGLTTTNRLTRHDGPASVLRAYTPTEVHRISARVDIPLSVHTHPFWRMAAVGRGVVADDRRENKLNKQQLPEIPSLTPAHVSRFTPQVLSGVGGETPE